jgi:protease IV
MKRWFFRFVAALIAGSIAGTCVSFAAVSSPATRPANSFPTPAELMAKIKASQTRQKQERDRLPQVAYFDISSPLEERPSDFNLFSQDPDALTLRVLIDRLEKARHDDDIRAVLLRLDNGTLNLSQAMELRDELKMLKRDGKRTFVYADEYDTTSYLAASTATDVCMMEGGDIMIPGVGFETMFAKGLLDKIGVDADFVQIGEYKGADEEFTRTDASEELKGELNKLADSLYEQIIDTISSSRKLSPQDVKEAVDDSLITGKTALKRGLVDHLVDIGELRELMAKELGQKVHLVSDYGQAQKDDVDFSNPFALFALLAKKPYESDRPTVAVIYAEGLIVDGPSDDSLFSQTDDIGSDTMREAIRTAEKDDKVQAVVIRIDSPGGSALASEAMWQAARRLSKTRPVIVSVGSMAASGGYYLASAGDYIFADPTAIVGSIGVVGGKFVLKGLFTKIGLNTQSFLRGKNADLFSSETEWNDVQRQQVTRWMRETYDQFTERVMTTRKGKIKDIDAVARGRIFSARQAKDLGMVDRIGGIEDAIAYAAGKANLKPGDYDVRVLPQPRSLADLLNRRDRDDDDDAATRFSSRTSGEFSALLQTLSPRMRMAVALELNELMLLQRRPVMLTAPVVFTVR